MTDDADRYWENLARAVREHSADARRAAANAAHYSSVAAGRTRRQEDAVGNIVTVCAKVINDSETRNIATEREDQRDAVLLAQDVLRILGDALGESG